MKRFKIIEISGQQRRERTDLVTMEYPLTIEVNSRQTANLACSPRDLKDLVVGYLYTNGFINGRRDIRSLRIDRGRHKAIARTRSPIYPAASSRQITGTEPGFLVGSEKIVRLMKRFHTKSAEYQKTGGTHSAALCRRDKILVYREDLGRHNALDKVIGAALLKDQDGGDTFLLISSRIPEDILLKIVRCRIPLIASFSAPTDRAVEMARRAGVTLIGFVRGARFNIYSAPDRVK